MSNQQLLMTELKFTDEDLMANRQGQLSERQRQYLAIDRRKNIMLGAVILLCLIVGITSIMFIGLRDSNVILQGVALILLFCCAMLSWYFGQHWIRMTYDLRSLSVDVVEGKAQHVVRQVGRAKAGSVRIGERVEVPTNIDAFKAFSPGAVYRLYRTSHSHQLLSVEEME